MLAKNISEDNKIKILILGGTGQLGSMLSRDLSALGEVTSLDRKRFDFENPENLELIMQQLKPKFVINAAAYTNVDGAEENEKTASKINALTVKKIAELCHFHNSALIHFSTDYIFDGDKGSPYNEDDEPNPLSIYGRSKLEGENYVIKNASKFLILRTSGVISNNTDNFLSKIKKLAENLDSLSVVSDQVSSLNFSGFLSEAVVKILCSLDPDLSKEKRWGVYHLSGDLEGTWFDFANYAQKLSKENNPEISFSSIKIHPVSSKKFKQKAKRPNYSFLSSAKLKDKFHIELPDWKKSVSIVMKNL